MRNLNLSQLFEFLTKQIEKKLKTKNNRKQQKISSHKNIKICTLTRTAVKKTQYEYWDDLWRRISPAIKHNRKKTRMKNIAEIEERGSISCDLGQR